MKIIEDKDYDPNSDEDETAMTARIMTMTQNYDDVINKPSLKPKENSHLGISTLIPLSKLTDDMDPKAKKLLLPARQRRKLLQVRQNAIVLPTFYVSKNAKSHHAGYGSMCTSTSSMDTKNYSSS
jgi:hypothetical protein